MSSRSRQRQRAKTNDQANGGLHFQFLGQFHLGYLLSFGLMATRSRRLLRLRPQQSYRHLCRKLFQLRTAHAEREVRSTLDRCGSDLDNHLFSFVGRLATVPPFVGHHARLNARNIVGTNADGDWHITKRLHAHPPNNGLILRLLFVQHDL